MIRCFEVFLFEEMQSKIEVNMARKKNQQKNNVTNNNKKKTLQPLKEKNSDCKTFSN